MPYIDDSTKYQFVKFKDGKEIFAMVREVFTNDQLELHFPMNIQLQPAMSFLVQTQYQLKRGVPAA